MIPPDVDPRKVQENFRSFFRHVIGRCQRGNHWHQQQVTRKSTAKTAMDLVRKHFENPHNPESQEYEIIRSDEECGLIGCRAIKVIFKKKESGEEIARRFTGVGVCSEPDGPSKLWETGGLFWWEVNLNTDR